MAHAIGLSGDRPEDRSGFTVASDAIPVGVHCRSCGRLILPERLRPVAVRPRPHGRTEVTLQCVRCETTGTVLLEREHDDHRGLLAIWTNSDNDTIPDRTRRST